MRHLCLFRVRLHQERGLEAESKSLNLPRIMPASRSSNVPGHASGINLPGLQGFKGLAMLIYHDDGKPIFRSGIDLDKQTEYDAKIFFSMARHFVNCSTQDLESGARGGDCIAMYYLAARLYTGARVTQDRPMALRLWTKVSQVDIPDGATITSIDDMARGYARIKADAYASLGAHHLRNYEKSKSLFDLTQAFLCGEGAAQLGLFVAASHYTLLAFYKLQKGTPVRTEDDVSVETKSRYTCSRAEAPALAAIVKCRTMLEGGSWAEFSAPEEEPEPETYTCSRPGCTTTTTVRSDIRRCAGLCSVTHKPGYCTKQCQTKDWKRHRSQCSRPTEEDRTIQFNALTTQDRVNIDTSGMSSIDLELAQEYAKVSMYDELGGDNPSPQQKAFREFIQEMEETACGGPRTGEQFARMIKDLPKVYGRRDLNMVLEAGKRLVAG
ncbi:hypothetical protein PENSPDRAFT_164448 [Peniophora sp. CONT]|nr:hypothetical protein PENSPDRAFT_164448 [Peniophora sp. CONT]